MSQEQSIKPSQILVAGGTGLIGSALVGALLDKGYSVMVLTRDHNRIPPELIGRVGFMEWDGNFSSHLTQEVKNSFAIINLAGEGIADKPWTMKRRFQLIRSRLGTTRALAKACQFASHKPKVFIQASAVGYYPDNTKDPCVEESPAGSSFVSRLVVDWEAVAMHELPNEVRLVILRSGVVLSANGGLIAKLLTPTRLFLGAWFGSGKQYISWIHIQDHLNATIHLLTHPHAQGAFNLVAPNPVKQRKLVRRLAKRINRVAWIAIPAFLVRWVFGAMGTDVLLTGQNVSSARLQDSGFSFKFPSLDDAINDIVPR